VGAAAHPSDTEVGHDLDRELQAVLDQALADGRTEASAVT
jgi:hypothetical protein